jgi:hypothetical protein
MLVKE